MTYSLESFWTGRVISLQTGDGGTSSAWVRTVYQWRLCGRIGIHDHHHLWVKNPEQTNKSWVTVYFRKICLRPKDYQKERNTIPILANKFCSFLSKFNFANWLWPCSNWKQTNWSIKSYHHWIVPPLYQALWHTPLHNTQAVLSQDGLV